MPDRSEDWLRQAEARYPNGFAQGAPTDYCTAAEADAAIDDADAILEFCRGAMG